MSINPHKLDPVLRLRQRAERELQLEMADLERQRQALEGQLRDQHRTVVSARGDLRARLAPGGVVFISGVRRQASTALDLMARAQQQAVELAAVHRRIAEARGRLAEATARRRAIDRLRERRFAELRLDEHRKEINRADDITAARRRHTIDLKEVS